MVVTLVFKRLTSFTRKDLEPSQKHVLVNEECRNRCKNAKRVQAEISTILFVCLSLFQVGIYNSIKTNKNQPSSLYKK